MKCPAEVYQPSARSSVLLTSIPTYTSSPITPLLLALRPTRPCTCGLVPLRTGRRLFELWTLDLTDATLLAKSRSLTDPGYYGLPHPLLSTYADLQIQGYFDLETRVLEPLDNPFGPRCHLCSRYIM
jgi:hypothetical protein